MLDTSVRVFFPWWKEQVLIVSNVCGDDSFSFIFWIKSWVYAYIHYSFVWSKSHHITFYNITYTKHRRCPYIDFSVKFQVQLTLKQFFVVENSLGGFFLLLTEFIILDHAFISQVHIKYGRYTCYTLNIPAFEKR